MSKRHPWANRGLLWGIHFTLALTKEQYQKACKHLAVPSHDWDAMDSAGAALLFEYSEGKAIIVALKEWESAQANELLALIVHEAVHVWQYTKKHIEEEKAGDEIEAYAIQNITQELFNLFDQLSEEA